MQIGDLRHRVTVQNSTETSDGHDGFTQTWSDVQRRIAAMVKPLAGRDLDSARQIDPRISHAVTFRYWRNYQTDLDGGRARLVYHDLTDRTFEPVTPPIDEGERHILLTVQCREMA